MRTTVALDDILMDRARELTGVKETSALLREGLKALIERESARRLARLGGEATLMRRLRPRAARQNDPRRLDCLDRPFPWRRRLRLRSFWNEV